MAERQAPPNPGIAAGTCGRDPLIDAITVFLAREDAPASGETATGSHAK